MARLAAVLKLPEKYFIPSPKNIIILLIEIYY